MGSTDDVGRAAVLTSGVLALEDELHGAEDPILDKDLILGASISQIKDRDEYKAKQAEAQFAVPEDQIVDGVRKVLTKHGVTWG